METNISNKCKAYTSLKQSKKLAEILPHDTADGTWKRVVIAGCNLDVPEEQQYFHDGDTPFMYYSGIGIPSWSLAALLDILESEIDGEEGETYKLNIEKDGTWWNVWYREQYDEANPIEIKSTEKLIDACVEMIIKLNEQKLL
jgi:hypothetical protein